MYFRSLAVFAFAACATFVSAAPAPSPLELVAARASADLALAMRDITTDTAAAIAARDNTPTAPTAPTALPTPSKILQNMTVKLTPIVKNLRAAVSNKAELKQEQIVGYLNDAIAILKTTHDELQTVAKNPAGLVTGVLTLGTTFATLGPFLNLIFSVLALVLQVVADTPLGPIVQPLVATVGTLLQEVVALVVTLLPGILTLLAPVLAILSPILHALQLDDLLSIINIPGLTL